MSPGDSLQAIFDADRKILQAEADLLAYESKIEVCELLQEAILTASALKDRSEASMRLLRLADLCAQLPGPKMVDALILILNREEAQVRVAAGEAIRDVGYERYAEVARGIERALENKLDGRAMTELPWVLAEIGEPSALPLIRSFLAHTDPEVVAAAIESLAQLNDPEAIEALRPFQKDQRRITIEDFEEETSATLAELATEAIEMLEAALP